jgi:outer membrane protein assembly factor BamB
MAMEKDQTAPAGVHWLVALAWLGLVTSVPAEDWPRWRGPQADGVSRATNWTAQWPKEGPVQLWRAAVGTGFSSVAVSEGGVYTMGNDGTADNVFCFNAQSGKLVWKQSYPCPLDPNMFEGGPSGTPAVDGKQVYTSSRQGQVHCFEAVTGKLLWSRNLQKDLELVPPAWGFGASPLVEGNLVILNAGDHGVALDKATGKMVWASTVKDGAGYAAPVPYDAGTMRCVAIFATAGLVSVEAATGKELWRHPWPTSSDVNAADPIISGNQFFISSGYGTGGALVVVTNNRPVEVWKNQNMLNHFNSAVLYHGHLYGLSGQAGEDIELRCVALRTGELGWSQKIFGSYGTLMVADGKLIVFTERGELLVGAASPAGFKAISRSQVIGGKCWTPPVLSDGRLYCRNAQGTLVCVDVRGK